MSFRKEMKIRVSIHEYNQLQGQLFNQGMRLLYNPRVINSIYFDTKNLAMLHDSEEGILPRKKIRIRWYDKEESFTLEKKISSTEGRFKTTEIINNILSENQLIKKNYFDPQYGELNAFLQICYTRSYFKLDALRITFDQEIKYQNLQTNINRWYYDPERVIEIKVPITCSDDYIQKYIPFPTTRFSKYSRGVLLSNGELCET